MWSDAQRKETVMEHLEVIITEEQMQAIVEGWSARKDILGQPVYNTDNEKIGTIDDVIITPSNCVSFAIIGVGGFLGLAKNDVAIPMEEIDWDEDRFLLPGATKEELKSLPTFEYGREEEKKAHH